MQPSTFWIGDRQEGHLRWPEQIAIALVDGSKFTWHIPRWLCFLQLAQTSVLQYSHCNLRYFHEVCLISFEQAGLGHQNKLESVSIFRERRNRFILSSWSRFRMTFKSESVNWVLRHGQKNSLILPRSASDIILLSWQTEQHGYLLKHSSSGIVVHFPFRLFSGKSTNTSKQILQVNCFKWSDLLPLQKMHFSSPFILLILLFLRLLNRFLSRGRFLLFMFSSPLNFFSKYSKMSTVFSSSV